MFFSFNSFLLDRDTLIAPYASEFLLKLVQKADKISVTEKSVWLEPLMGALETENDVLQRNLNAYLMQPLLKTCSSIFRDLLGLAKSSGLEALVSLLRYGRKFGLVENHEVSEFIGDTAINEVLCHQNESLRMNAILMIVDVQKPSMFATETEWRQVMLFLRTNIRSSHAEFRSQFIAVFGKFIHRICKHLNPPSYYGNFLRQLVDFLMNNLHPGANYPRVTTTLHMLLLLLDYYTWDRLPTIDQDQMVRCLLLGLSDDLDKNRSMAYRLLLTFQDPLRQFDIHCLSRETFKMLDSSRTLECESAAWMARLLFIKYGSKLTFDPSMKELDPDHACNYFFKTTWDGRIFMSAFLVVEHLLHRLDDHLRSARQNILVATESKPLYGTLLALQ